MRKVLMLAIATLFVASSGRAAMIQEGTRELGVAGLIDFESGSGTLIDITVGYGYFVADHLEIGGSVGIVDDDDFTQWRIGGFTEYNFDLGTAWVPFLGGSIELSGASLDYGTLDEDNTAVVFGFDAGVKYFLVEHLAITTALDFNVATDDIYQGKDEAEDTDFSVEIGLRCYF